MQYTSCNRCHGPLDPGYRFCKTCGLDQANPFANVQVPMQQQGMVSDESQALKTLMLVLAIRYGAMILTTVVYYFTRLTGIGYGITRWADRLFSAGFIVALLIFAIQTRHKTVKMILWIVFGIEIFYLLKSFFGYDFF